jgi:4-oxalocrotonate tautomerase
MPYLDIRIAAPCLPETVQKFAARLTDLTAELLAKKRELTAVSLQCIAPGHWYVGGVSLSDVGGTSFFVEANVTAGTNDARQKEAFVAAAFAVAEEILGKLDAASYVIVREVPADAWGYQGKTQAQRAREHVVAA